MENLLYTKSDFEREGSVSQNSKKHDSNYRTEFHRDYARLIHSAAFRRLQGKTQLFPGIESDFFRNRLTHSIEVAQIAKSIAIKLNKESQFFNGNQIDLEDFSSENRENRGRKMALFRRDLNCSRPKKTKIRVIKDL